MAGPESVAAALRHGRRPPHLDIQVVQRLLKEWRQLFQGLADYALEFAASHPALILAGRWKTNLLLERAEAIRSRCLPASGGSLSKPVLEAKGCFVAVAASARMSDAERYGLAVARAPPRYASRMCRTMGAASREPDSPVSRAARATIAGASRFA